MRRITVPRRSLPIGTVVLGLALGATLGFVLGELAGPVTRRALQPRRAARRGIASVAETVFRAQAALDDDLPLRECRLQVLPVGPGRIELHGWVHDRRARSRAGRLVVDAVDATVINCVRVRGEDDDLPDAPDAPDADERLA